VGDFNWKYGGRECYSSNEIEVTNPLLFVYSLPNI
tara:strand:- start:282 stop:386 length:105 start_codon:yes stop_codon:yes gene_type:complete